MEQVRHLKKNKRNRTNSQQTGVSKKYNCGMDDVGCSEDASTALPFESGQIGKGFPIYSECIFFYFVLDIFLYISFCHNIECASVHILSHFICIKAVIAESRISVIKYCSKSYGEKEYLRRSRSKR